MRNRSLRTTILLLVLAAVSSSVENHATGPVQSKDHILPVERYEAGSALHEPQELLDDPQVLDHPFTSRRLLNGGGLGRRLGGGEFGPDQGGKGQGHGGDDDDDDDDDEGGGGGGGGGGDGLCIGFCPGGGNGGGGGGGGGRAAATTQTTNSPTTTPESTGSSAAAEEVP